MADLLLHPTTKHQLTTLLQSPPHAVLISGGAGVGKEAVADLLARQILSATAIANNPSVLHIKPEEQSIGIESVRAIGNFLKRKTTGVNNIRRIVLITEAHRMSTEAQNALLKTLEEPPADTMIVLTADDPTALKPTVRSRSQHVLVLPVSLDQAEVFFKSGGHSQAAIQTAYYMSEGRAGLLAAMLEGSEEHELVAAIDQSKNLLQMTTYERLLQVETLSKQKLELVVLLQGLERVVLSGLRRAADKNNELAVKKFYRLSKQIQKAQEALARNGNAKIVLTDLFLNL